MFPAPVRHDPRRLFPGLRATPTIAKLQIGIALDPRSQPAWTRELIDFLGQISQFEISVLPRQSTDSPAAVREPWFARRLIEPSRRMCDPFAPGLVTALRTIDQRELDLVLSVAPGLPPYTARYGVLFLHFGDRNIHPPYFGEVLAGDPISRVEVRWHEEKSTPASVIRAAEIPTLRSFPYTRNAEECIPAAVQMVTEVALDIAEQGPAWLTGARTMAVAPQPLARRPPTNFESIGFAWRERFPPKKQNPVPGKMEWFCALRREPSTFYTRTGRFERTGIEDIPKPHGGQMADPFLIADRGVDWLFFEDIPPGQEKGRISCLHIPESGQKFPEPEVVIECETHLSYPCVFRHKTDYFMIPESCASQDVRLYRATSFPYQWQLESVLLEEIPLTDTTPFFLDDHWYFFTTTMPPVQQTVLLTATKLGGPLRLHPQGMVTGSWRNARSAGHLFSRAGRLFRPAQDCVERYGFGISINEVMRLTPSEYCERPAGYIGPDWRPGLLGTHTLNANERLEVIDARRYAESMDDAS